ncbi:MAG: hypothetical protein ACXAEI_16555, partial [Candidatus Hodarchaeales archaeon]
MNKDDRNYCSFCDSEPSTDFCDKCNRYYCLDCKATHELTHSLKKTLNFSSSEKHTLLALFNYYSLLYGPLIAFGSLALVGLIESLWLILDSKNYAEGVDSATDGFMAFVAGLIIGWITYSF